MVATHDEALDALCAVRTTDDCGSAGWACRVGWGMRLGGACTVRRGYL